MKLEIHMRKRKIFTTLSISLIYSYYRLHLSFQNSDELHRCLSTPDIYLECPIFRLPITRTI